MATRKLVNVQPVEVSTAPDAKKAAPEQVRLPAVFAAPIRTDIVHFVHTNMAKNTRQAYAVNKMSGTQHSAESWGTGRAVSRIPRISGGGTKRSGEGAFGNMCRQGRMAHPTKIWRRWHRMLNVNQKRFAVASALAASAVPALVMARGHRIEQVPEVPLIVPASVESVEKTKKAAAILDAIKASADVQHSKDTHHVRQGKGKIRNRRYIQRRGPLVVFNEDHGIARAFRNLPGVEVIQVDRLNLLLLAPGGHVGRFVIWTKPAIERLNKLFGTLRTGAQLKHGYHLPRPLMANPDLARIINSDEIQSVVRPALPNKRQYNRHKNPLANRVVMEKLNPYAATIRKQEQELQKQKAKRKAVVLEAKKKGQHLPKTAHQVAMNKRRKLHVAAKKKTYAMLATESAYDASTALKQL